jgi:DNA-binding CsgD family transcriptional regulator/PAS domain-containing protein
LATDKSAPPPPSALEAFDKVSLPPGAFSRLVGALYEGPLEPVPWSGLLLTLREALHANWVTLILRPPTSARQALILNAGPHGVERPKDQFASEYAFAMDAFSGLPEGQVLSVDEVLGDSAWVASEFYRQFVCPYGIRYMIGADLHAPDGIECRLRVCRAAEQGEFSAEDKSYCQVLLPHLRQAIQLHANLDTADSERTLYAAAVDSMLVGIVILDEHGAIMKTNSAADDILAQRDGLSRARGGVHADYPQEDRELMRLVGQALARSGSSATRSLMDAAAITRPSGRHKLGVLVRSIPLNDWSESGRRSSVAIFIRDPERHSQASHALIHKLFELTPAEASLALLLANGLTLDEAAAKLDIRKNTARAHLRSIFSKTGVTRQTALVHLILNSVASLG